ncbi:cation transporter [Cognatitamlana onchidii]|uniref:cation transporter n=1 Tax=Cognatitamlana onchidii TaxID=2562860 RepID=UPI0010A683F9|nr:heavy metal-associated domain-containing protein [Algibacter onchidii]
MKLLKHILLLSLIVAIVSCKQKEAEVKTIEVETTAVKEIDPNATYAKAEFTIDGMTCAIGCAATIQKKISKMDGVKTATVDFDRKLAMVEYNEAKVTPTTLEEAVSKVSNTYKVSDMKTVETFSSEKTCASDCKKACCSSKDKKTCKTGCTKDCCNKDAKKGEKMACKADCKETCCTKKAA